MGYKSRSERKSAGSHNRIGIFGAGRNNRDEDQQRVYSDQGNFSEEGAGPDESFDEEFNGPADDLLRRAIDKKRGMFKKPPRPVYDSWNLPEESSIKPAPTHAGKGPKGYRRSDDRIREDVCEALSSHPEIDASDMEVDVKDGLVIFKGSVESRLVKRMAEDLIENIPGVVDVRNELYFTNGPVLSPKTNGNGNGKKKHHDR
ncbi:MAG: hypothetical protein K0R29_1154 [Pseudobdellovibrio sp.]|jgi:osmotically-inducible protein OsmY|nr:hypothetical protein [Pseudobdellovibrio sp.]